MRCSYAKLHLHLLFLCIYIFALQLFWAVSMYNECSLALSTLHMPLFCNTETLLYFSLTQIPALSLSLYKEYIYYFHTNVDHRCYSAFYTRS